MLKIEYNDEQKEINLIGFKYTLHVQYSFVKHDTRFTTSQNYLRKINFVFIV